MVRSTGWYAAKALTSFWPRTVLLSNAWYCTCVPKQQRAKRQIVSHALDKNRLLAISSINERKPIEYCVQPIRIDARITEQSRSRAAQNDRVSHANCGTPPPGAKCKSHWRNNFDADPAAQNIRIPERHSILLRRSATTSVLTPSPESQAPSPLVRMYRSPSMKRLPFADRQ